MLGSSLPLKQRDGAAQPVGEAASRRRCRSCGESSDTGGQARNTRSSHAMFGRFDQLHSSASACKWFQAAGGWRWLQSTLLGCG